ncbi:MAG: hypothetical protein JSV03_11755, partial [Planctomycetota bacterium]
MIRFEIHAEEKDQRMLLWSEDIPPFCGPQWWEDRLISLADFAGRNVTLHLKAEHIDGRSNSQITIGFENVSLLDLQK